MAKVANPESTGSAFPIKYEIVQVERWTVVDARGNPAPGYKITYTFEGGFPDTLDVRESDYNPESVKARIEAAITKHVGVLSLGA